MSASLAISFTYGVEYGRLLQKMEQGDDHIDNNGFPVRIENIALIKTTCNQLGYIPSFGTTHYHGWVDFLGIKNLNSNN